MEYFVPEFKIGSLQNLLTTVQANKEIIEAQLILIKAKPSQSHFGYHSELKRQNCCLAPY